ncbi:hypothetical protein GJW-30_1_01750 [Variibacter gotjawalensis]|uniref:Uncharacterized protein n=1 Tax=Variibacter gotjawalensis TaxID=1333996 RepID=A0A0S3PTK7_9BRAD|nr:DNA-binding protein [Variibacter gotjawalensis]NIK49535.1 hypothetical protein [Variibacter gotjawalensis]RZS51386.1 hypothetical protein EV661_3865 [Variibacter gotjawalensis]BAT59219.1 hypothetical protein GJW-30_1_01750 [Variibacter gotjawalensis]
MDLRSLSLSILASAALAGYAYSQTPGQPPIPPGIQVGLTQLEGVVREIFGNKFVLEDATGRKLIETGPRGSELARVSVGDKVSVEVTPRDGFFHAASITLANGQRVVLAGAPPAPRGRDAAYDERGVLDAVQRAGFRDARVQEVKKKHVEVVAVDASGKSWELHVEFDGRIRKQEALVAMNDADVKALIERAGYTYGGSMRPKKKHMVVTAINSRGERVEIDVHRDGTIKKEKRIF